MLLTNSKLLTNISMEAISNINLFLLEGVWFSVYITLHVTEQRRACG